MLCCCECRMPIGTCGIVSRSIVSNTISERIRCNHAITNLNLSIFNVQTKRWNSLEAASIFDMVLICFSELCLHGYRMVVSKCGLFDSRRQVIGVYVCVAEAQGQRSWYYYFLCAHGWKVCVLTPCDAHHEPYLSVDNMNDVILCWPIFSC